MKVHEEVIRPLVDIILVSKGLKGNNRPSPKEFPISHLLVAVKPFVKEIPFPFADVLVSGSLVVVCNSRK